MRFKKLEKDYKGIDMTTEDIDKTIEKLCSNLKPVKCCNPTRRSLLWVLVVVSYMSAVSITIGFRENIVESMGREDFVFELALAFAIALSASLMTFWLSIPDCGKYKKFLAVPLTLLAVQLMWVMDRTFFEGLGDFRENWLSHCWMNAVLHTTLPALLVIVLIKKGGATVMPCWLATNAMIAVTEFSWVGMRLICPKDNVGEAYILNFLPYVIVGAILGFVAKRLFRW